MNNIKERLKAYIQTTGITNAEFERTAGLGNGYVNNVGAKISKGTLNVIEKAYPTLNTDWLLTGKGEMLINTPKDRYAVVRLDGTGARVYDIDATCGASIRDFNFVDERIIGFVDIPGVRKGTHILRANGDSMEPNIKDGDWIAVREVFNFNEVFYGQIYLVITEEYRMVKQVNPGDDNESLRLHSKNTEYADINIRKDRILKMFLVENILSVKIQI